MLKFLEEKDPFYYYFIFRSFHCSCLKRPTTSEEKPAVCKGAICQGKLGLYTQPGSQKKRKDVGQIYKAQLSSLGSYLFMKAGERQQC